MIIYTLRFSDQAKGDIKHHKQSGNKVVVNKISLLLEELTKHPFIGTGKPEQLKHNLTGCWSRRLVYEVVDNVIMILSAKGHYQ